MYPFKMDEETVPVDFWTPVVLSKDMVSAEIHGTTVMTLLMWYPLGHMCSSMAEADCASPAPCRTVVVFGPKFDPSNPSQMFGCRNGTSKSMLVVSRCFTKFHEVH